MLPRALLAYTLIGLSLATAAAAQRRMEDECREWIEKKGYSTDYIEQRVGKRQPGLAPNWRANVATRDVAKGDVIISRLPGEMKAYRVAFVESVVNAADGSVEAVNVSEWNMGPYVERRCFITQNFGRTTTARIPIGTVDSVWRPSLPLP